MPAPMVGTREFRWEELTLQHLPEEAGFQALYTIYLDEIHPIFPVIDREAMEAMSVTSPECSLLRLAVCIAASVNPRAKDYLKPPLRNRNYYSSRDGLIKDMIFSLRLLLSLGLVKDKIVLVQALSLVALFTQYAKDRDLSAELSASAIGYSHTAGIHLDNQSGSEEARCRLFCCVWALDKLNAATHGRPVMMHPRDIGRNVTDAILAQQPAFQLLLWIVVLLDKVIEIYRPHSELETFPESDFPLFEDLIDKTNAGNVNSRFLGKIYTHSLLKFLANNDNSHRGDTLPLSRNAILPRKIPPRARYIVCSVPPPKPLCNKGYIARVRGSRHVPEQSTHHPIRHISFTARCVSRPAHQSLCHAAGKSKATAAS